MIAVNIFESVNHCVVISPFAHYCRVHIRTLQPVHYFNSVLCTRHQGRQYGNKQYDYFFHNMLFFYCDCSIFYYCFFVTCVSSGKDFLFFSFPYSLVNRLASSPRRGCFCLHLGPSRSATDFLPSAAEGTLIFLPRTAAQLFPVRGFVFSFSYCFIV